MLSCAVSPSQRAWRVHACMARNSHWFHSASSCVSLCIAQLTCWCVAVMDMVRCRNVLTVDRTTACRGRAFVCGGWQLLWNMRCNSSCILSHRYLHPLTAPTELPDFPHSSSLLEPGTSLLFVPNILME